MPISTLSQQKNKTDLFYQQFHRILIPSSNLIMNRKILIFDCHCQIAIESIEVQTSILLSESDRIRGNITLQLSILPSSEDESTFTCDFTCNKTARETAAAPLPIISVDMKPGKIKWGTLSSWLRLRVKTQARRPEIRSVTASIIIPRVGQKNLLITAIKQQST